MPVIGTRTHQFQVLGCTAVYQLELTAGCRCHIAHGYTVVACLVGNKDVEQRTGSIGTHVYKAVAGMSTNARIPVEGISHATLYVLIVHVLGLYIDDAMIRLGLLGQVSSERGACRSVRSTTVRLHHEIERSHVRDGQRIGLCIGIVVCLHSARGLAAQSQLIGRSLVNTGQ